MNPDMTDSHLAHFAYKMPLEKLEADALAKVNLLEVQLTELAQARDTKISAITRLASRLAYKIGYEGDFRVTRVQVADVATALENSDASLSIKHPKEWDPMTGSAKILPKTARLVCQRTLDDLIEPIRLEYDPKIIELAYAREDELQNVDLTAYNEFRNFQNTVDKKRGPLCEAAGISMYKGKFVDEAIAATPLTDTQRTLFAKCYEAQRPK